LRKQDERMLYKLKIVLIIVVFVMARHTYMGTLTFEVVGGEREDLPGNVDDGVEEAGESESHAKKGAKGEERGILEKGLEGVDEEIEAAYGRNVQSQRHGGERYGEYQLKHFPFFPFSVSGERE